MNARDRWFWGIVVAQVALLLGWAGYHEYIRQNAPVILLRAHPVDPRDLLRGDYMTLRYEIQDVTATHQGDAFGDSLWVVLEQRGKYYEAVDASRVPVAPKPNQFVVRGTVTYSWRNGKSDETVDYGIERYFVPEGKGSPRFKEIEVEASVSPAHWLYIRRVLLDGKPYP
jgi:uncharacterized membrane-anchored protein